MLGIRLLGGFELSLAGVSTPGRVGPKLQGLLAFLAMNRGVVVPRGRLADLLWGEREEELARHSLSQALTTLRSMLGPAATALQACPEGVRLATEGLELDVDAFERTARGREQGTLQEACDRYRGAFLEGLEIREAAFEEWQLSERYRLAELAADALGRLLDLQITAGGADAAIETARRLVAIAPLDESTHARLIELYAEKGRRGLAEAQYARCSDLLRRELDQQPGDELRAALADARRRTRGPSVSLAPGSNPERTQDRPDNAKRVTKRAWIASAAAVAMLLVLGALWAMHGNSIGNARENADSYDANPWNLPGEPSIAVLPFENLSGDSEQAYLADGITNDIITDLSRFSQLFVTASNSSSRYTGRAVTVPEVARDLGVRYVLTGSVQRADSRLQINAKLIDATTGRHVWAERYERPTKDLFAAQKEITRTIVGMVGSGRGELQRAELERLARFPTEDLHAYEFYLRGIAHSQRKTRENNALAREMFEKALQADPNYARAAAECSMTYLLDIFRQWTDSWDESLQKAEELAWRAIEIDSSEPWGFVTLGLVYQIQGRNDRALPLFETAYALNPNDYDISEALGYAMTWNGSAERAVELLEQAQRLDPYHVEEPRVLGVAYFFVHRYEEALEIINAVVRPDNTPAYWLYKAAAHAELDHLDEARAAIAEALKLDPALTLQSEHERRLALGLAPVYAEHLTEALRKAGLPERGHSSVAIDSATRPADRSAR
jgi:TolB-like protein/DNA-binding SARP family transcriptional activator/Tfp pilus assembly protein PilF